MSQTFELSINDKQQLVLRRSDQPEAVGVVIRRSFPWSNPNQFLSIRSAEGRELHLIDDLADVPEQQRALIRNWMADQTFIPRITRVDDLDVRFGYQQWTVGTDRGPAAFRVQEREDIRFLDDGRFSVKDAEGNIYELPRLDQLDPQSRKVVETIL